MFAITVRTGTAAERQREQLEAQLCEKEPVMWCVAQLQLAPVASDWRKGETPETMGTHACELKHYANHHEHISSVCTGTTFGAPLSGQADGRKHCVVHIVGLSPRQ